MLLYETKQIQPLTIDMLNKLSKEDRHKAIHQYHTWLQKVRLQDKRVSHSKRTRIDKFHSRQQQRFLTTKRITPIPLGQLTYYVYYTLKGEITEHFNYYDV